MPLAGVNDTMFQALILGKWFEIRGCIGAEFRPGIDLVFQNGGNLACPGFATTGDPGNDIVFAVDSYEDSHLLIAQAAFLSLSATLAGLARIDVFSALCDSRNIVSSASTIPER